MLPVRSVMAFYCLITFLVFIPVELKRVVLVMIYFFVCLNTVGVIQLCRVELEHKIEMHHRSPAFSS